MEAGDAYILLETQPSQREEEKEESLSLDEQITSLNAPAPHHNNSTSKGHFHRIFHSEPLPKTKESLFPIFEFSLQWLSLWIFDGHRSIPNFIGGVILNSLFLLCSFWEIFNQQTTELAITSNRIDPIFSTSMVIIHSIILIIERTWHKLE